MAGIEYKPVVYTLSAVAAILYIVCAVFYAVAPNSAIRFYNLYLHGMDIEPLAGTITFGNAVFGLILTVVSVAVISALFVAIYNKIKK